MTATQETHELQINHTAHPLTEEDHVGTLPREGVLYWRDLIKLIRRPCPIQFHLVLGVILFWAVHVGSTINY